MKKCVLLAAVLLLTAAMVMAGGQTDGGGAAAMAEGTLNSLCCDFALSVTGIAGPDGGTEEKPVGTVYIGIAGKKTKTETMRLFFPVDRDKVRTFTANTAPFHFYRYIEKEVGSTLS